jgi:hypothetical protein
VIKFFGAKFDYAKGLGLYLGSFGCPYKFIFQITWLDNRRKEICGSGK